MSWGQGRAVVERLLDGGHLEQVLADVELAKAILDQAKRHLETADREADLDPHMAYSALYDAARKALAALLQIQGLRPSRAGGHLALIDTVTAQLDPPLGGVLRPLDRMRRTRHAAEYPTASSVLTADNIRADLPKAREIVKVADRLMAEMTVFTR